jgi:phosphatidylserine/phosphatidylglycerophosphate/cardiolipin synthase-like enzyme
MVSKALKYHAKRGTQIRIILPGLPIGNFVHAEDQKLLDSLTKSKEPWSKNIKVQLYRYFPKNGPLVEMAKFIERSYHAKALAVLSRKPGESGVIVGGRNIKDTFYFHDTPKFPGHDDMVKYRGPGDPGPGDPYIFFGDLEVSMRSREIAEQVAANIVGFYDRDMWGPRMVRMSQHVPTLNLTAPQRADMISKLRTTNTVRFFYSVPFIQDEIDGKTNMEKLYISMIDAAKTSIKLVNPYVVPPQVVGDALRRAAERGVHVDFVSTLNFSGDNSPGFTGDLNKLFFNKLHDENEHDMQDSKHGGHAVPIDVYEWNTKPRSIMHAKTMLIDDDLLYVGSANFDYRSTVQDIEDGFLMTGQLAKDFKDLYANFYLNPANSKPVTEKEKVGLFSWSVNILVKALALPPPVAPPAIKKDGG